MKDGQLLRILTRPQFCTPFHSYFGSYRVNQKDRQRICMPHRRHVYSAPVPHLAQLRFPHGPPEPIHPSANMSFQPCDRPPPPASSPRAMIVRAMIAKKKALKEAAARAARPAGAQPKEPVPSPRPLEEFAYNLTGWKSGQGRTNSARYRSANNKRCYPS